MDGKYSFVLEGNYTSEEMDAIDADSESKDELVSGDIIDRNGNRVGVFILNYDDSVTIKDRDNNVIRTAGE